MIEEPEDYKPMLAGVRAEYRGVRWYVGDLRLWVIIGVLVTLVTNGVTIWLYYYEARPTAKAAYDNIRSREKLLDNREAFLNQREHKLNRMSDSLNAKLYILEQAGIIERYNQ